MFDYLLEKIRLAPITPEPYPHIYLEGLFTEEHFQQIVGAREIALAGFDSDKTLFDELFAQGYKIINFPGCITDQAVYLNWHKDKSRQQNYNNSTCEGFGITLRLMQPKTPILVELAAFMNSPVLHQALADRFSIALDSVTSDSGIQKYLDGYEISPHPDIRQKALTYMVNVNPGVGSEAREHHTQYLKFREEYRYVQAYWNGNRDKNRCWVPWEWCETVMTQPKNNSIVIFSPSDASMHGVRARYDHLLGQRTQLYGNLWYRDLKVEAGPEWEDFKIEKKDRTPRPSPWARVKSAVPNRLRRLLKASPAAAAQGNVIANRKQKPY